MAASTAQYQSAGGEKIKFFVSNPVELEGTRVELE